MFDAFLLNPACANIPVNTTHSHAQSISPAYCRSTRVDDHIRVYANFRDLRGARVWLCTAKGYGAGVAGQWRATRWRNELGLPTKRPCANRRRATRWRNEPGLPTKRPFAKQRRATQWRNEPGLPTKQPFTKQRRATRWRNEPGLPTQRPFAKQRRATRWRQYGTAAVGKRSDGISAVISR